MDKVFKIHCSQIGKIMGRIGLTDAQEEKLKQLSEREKTNLPKPLTENMKAELAELREAKANPKLPTTCTTFLKEYYAGDYEELYSPQVRKGNLVEIDLIDFMAEQLGLGFVEKNTVEMHDEYMVGTCDVLAIELIVDTKAAWDKKALNDHAERGKMDSDNEWQGRGYMRLYSRQKFIVFHGLMNTPEECTYGDGEIVYDDLPANERWVAFKIQRDVTIEQEIIARVIECRKWLEDYHQKIIATLGKVH